MLITSAIVKALAQVVCLATIVINSEVIIYGLGSGFELEEAASV